MRNAQVVVIVLLMILFPPLVSAQEDSAEEGVELPLWTIEAHDTDPEVAQQQIADLVERGMLPVGLEYRPGRPTVVLYGLNLGNPIQEIALYTFEDLSQVNAGVREFIDRGFAPIDLSRHSGGLTFLFTKGGQQVGRWGIVSSNLNSVDIEGSFESLSADGFSPWGITIWQDEMLILAIEEPGRERARRSSVRLYNFDPRSYTAAVSSAIKEGLFPWGIAVQGAELYVQFTRDESEGESEGDEE